MGTRSPVTFRVTVYMRSVVACFKEFAAQLLPEHCSLQHRLHDGQHVYFGPYSGTWAREELRRIRSIDPDGLLLSCDIEADGSAVSKVRSVKPLAMRCNAFALDDKRKRKSTTLLGYFADLPDEVLLGNALQCAERLDCVAIAGLEESGRATTWYAQLVMSFAATYRGRRLELCYVRWLHTAAAVAAAARRELTEAERRGPFEAYRWAVHPPTRARGHPRAGSAWFGVVRPCEIKYRVHMCPSLDDAALFRLNTDVWEYM